VNLSLFSVIIGLGASAALLRLALSVEEGLRVRRLLEGLALLAGALIGARAAFVLAHLHYYSTRGNEILNIGAGGWCWPGAVAGAWLVAILFGWLLERRILATFDRFSVMILPLAFSFWLAAWSAGVAYGARLDPAVWWGMPMLDDIGVVAPRVPLQPAAALTVVLLFIILEWHWRRPAVAGRKAAVLLVALGIHTLLFTLLRADVLQKWLGLRLDVWASIVTILAGAGLLIGTFAVKSKKSLAQDEEDNA
jgi:prolipoprotein diacylglyceryltransferase